MQRAEARESVNREDSTPHPAMCDELRMTECESVCETGRTCLEYNGDGLRDV